jgi:glutathione S-transferase
MNTLLGEYFSPWTEKARWALTHHRVAHRYREHVPLLGEPLLRWAARSNGKVSVPLLLTAQGAIPDSFAIARYAEAHGQGSSLFPREAESAIVDWNARSELALRAARALYLVRVAQDREAKLEMQPALFPRWLRVAGLPLADAAIGFLRRKYAITEAADSAEQALVRELDALRAALGKTGAYLVGGRFSHADISMAVTLQFVTPPGGDVLPLGPATRRSCTEPALAARYADLLAWRDDLYARHR